MIKTDSTFLHKYTVDYSDVDDKRTLRPSHLIDYFQSISVMHSDYMGYDLEFFETKQIGWVLLYWHVQINRWPAEGEELTISTWSTDHKRVQANRDFAIEDKQGSEICYGASRWVLIDTALRRPAKPQKGFFDPYIFKNCREFKPETFKMNPVPEREPNSISTYFVTRHDTDTNGHTNNAVYIDWSTDNVPNEIYENKSLKDIKVAYKKECLRGTTVKIQTWIKGNEVISLFTDNDDEKIIFGQVITLWH